jgi:adenosylcobinamide-phosphate synthase
MPPDLVIALAILTIAVIVDRCAGEYPSCAHPVVWIGALISLGLKAAPARGWWAQFLFGMVLTLGIVALCAGLALFVLVELAAYPLVEILIGAYLLKASFALRELGAAAERVEQPLAKGDLVAARAGLSALCSRDPSDLSSEELAAAAVESLAENASDSVVAPLFYFLLLGVPGTLGYRAINTLDARIGYRDRYEALGKFAARLDDVVNWIPARLTALLLLMAGWLRGGAAREGWRILRRDGGKTPSPNGGRPMATMAGLLRVGLTKRGVYALGDPIENLGAEKIAHARRLVNAAGWMMIGLVSGLIVVACWRGGHGLPSVGVAGARLLPYTYSNAEE